MHVGEMDLAMESRNLFRIYMPLLDEGTSVIRPVYGELVENNIFLVLPTEDYSPEDEKWLFQPGTIIECMEEIWGGEEVLVARRIISMGDR